MQNLKLTTLMPSITKDVSYEYDAIKSDVFEAIISDILKDSHTSSNPYFEQVMGIPGAGKSTFTKKYKRDDAVFLNFDNVMERIPQYQKDILELGSVESFKKWEMPARVIGYEVLRRAVEAKANIFWDHSGLFVSCLDLIENIKKYNYNTHMFCLLCDVDEACKRAQQREQITKRHTPKEMIEQRAEKVKSFLDMYKKIADKVTVYDTTNGNFELK
ncbi:MAG: zeta toxin family protein [Alphaproteobacteria bacterium]